MPCPKLWGFLTVFGSACIYLSFGYNLTTGNMNPYLIAYLGISRSQCIWFKAVIFAGQALSMPVGGILASKTGFRLVTIIGSLLTSAGILLSYLTINYGFGAFIITYSVMFGIGIGLPYSVLISIATSWFPKNRALIMGILSAGLCIGGLVFNPIQIAVINPHNIRNLTDPQVKDNVPKNFLVLGGLMLVLQVIGLCLCRKCKENTNTDKPMGPESTDVEAPSESSSWPNSSHSIANNGIDHKKARQEVINYTTSTYKVYGGDFNLDDRLMTIIVTVKSVLSCFEGMLWGSVNDKFSFKLPFGWMLLQWALFMATFPFINQASFMNVLFGIWIFALFFSMAGHYVLLPAACTSLFGHKNMATIYGLVFLANAPSSLLLSAIISQFEIAGKWTAVYLSCTAILCISFLLLLFLRDDRSACNKINTPCAAICDPCRIMPGPKEDFSETTSDRSTVRV
nr:unnamed protein product [Spirometra erinaceieuropaei]